MPKMKTHSGAKKRFSVTKNGKLRHRRSNRAHILTKKSSKRKRQLREDNITSDADRARVLQMLAMK